MPLSLWDFQEEDSTCDDIKMDHARKWKEADTMDPEKNAMQMKDLRAWFMHARFPFKV